MTIVHEQKYHMSGHACWASSCSLQTVMFTCINRTVGSTGWAALLLLCRSSCSFPMSCSSILPALFMACWTNSLLNRTVTWMFSYVNRYDNSAVLPGQLRAVQTCSTQLCTVQGYAPPPDTKGCQKHSFNQYFSLGMLCPKSKYAL